MFLPPPPKPQSNSIALPRERTPHMKILKDIRNTWNKTYGEGTQFDLDYGKLVILALCIYISIQVS